MLGWKKNSGINEFSYLKFSMTAERLIKCTSFSDAKES